MIHLWILHPVRYVIEMLAKSPLIFNISTTTKCALSEGPEKTVKSTQFFPLY